MTSRDEPIRGVADTAAWVAVYRARESERPDALFRDPFAARLAAERGLRAAEAFASRQDHAWSFVVRTHLFDRFVAEAVAAGAGTVVNLGAGLDARPYRMNELPPSLLWIEVDLPEDQARKAQVLAEDVPICEVERLPLDLRDRSARRELFGRLGRDGRPVLVLTEGLIIYFERDEVVSLAQDLGANPLVTTWITDLTSPALLRVIRRQWGGTLSASPLRFAPPEGPSFFEPYGWRPTAVKTLLVEGARTKRAPFHLRLFALLPQGKGPPGQHRPWGGVCRLERVPGPP